jgi:hypothetical protein
VLPLLQSGTSALLAEMLRAVVGCVMMMHNKGAQHTVVSSASIVNTADSVHMMYACCTETTRGKVC